MTMITTTTLTEDERNREAIAQMCIANPPPESKESIPAGEFKRQFELPWVLLNKSILANSTKPNYYAKRDDRCVLCRSCARTGKHNTLTAFKMVVEYQDDPLKNFACLIRLTCHNCGFEQLVPMDRHPKYLFMEEKKQRMVGQLSEFTEKYAHKYDKEVKKKVEKQLSDWRTMSQITMSHRKDMMDAFALQYGFAGPMSKEKEKKT